MSIPCWRYVRYTDDGSALYQCLNCYNDWDARTAPGWFDTIREVPEPCEGSMSYTRGEDKVHFIRREVPVYKPTWTYCPYCAVAWEGPVVCNDDNEYMYGMARLAVYDMIRKRRSADGWKSLESPVTLWWVIQERSVWRDDTAQAGNVGSWEDKEHAVVGKMPTPKMLYLLRDYQARLDAEHNNDTHGFCDYHARLITKRETPCGYEITNYDWERNEPEYTKSKVDRRTASA
jgi:hypothetical protein